MTVPCASPGVSIFEIKKIKFIYMHISDVADQVKDEKEFIKFLDLLKKDYYDNPESWNNNTLEDFLDGAYGFTFSLSGYYRNQKQNVDFSRPSWSVFANILLAAKNYE